MSKLTPKQKAFADYYIETGNVTESAKKAGYKQPHVQGSQTLEKLSVRNYIDERMKEIDSKRVMDAQEALELLTSIARGEMEETVITASGKAVKRKADINQRQRAIESILKRYPTNRQEELKEQLLEAQIDKVKAETKNEETGGGRVIIVNDKEAMRKALEDGNKDD